MNGPQDGEGEGAWTKLTRRKVVQWGIAYAAGAWGVLQGVQFLAEAFEWPTRVLKLSTFALLVGLPVVLVLAWYHGDRGEQRVGRIELAVVTLLFLLGGGLFWRYERASEKSPATTTEVAAPVPAAAPADAGPSIAVLPFENRSARQDDAFFVDGIHDDILTQLAKVSAMKVISRTSVERFRDTKLPMKDIAQQLGVKSLLEGGVQRAGDRVRITVQLIDAATDAHLWAESYDRELTAANIFAIQSEVSTAIAAALKATLTPAEKARVNAVPTRNLDAWEAYQFGKQRLAKRTSGGMIEAEEFFRKAIERDPSFALAYSGLADSLSLQVNYGDAPLLATLKQAQAAADTALKLDPGLSEAWTSSAFIASNREQNDRAERMYRRAIELNPNNAMALKFYGQLLVATGRIDEGLRALENAAGLDPLSAIVQQNLAMALENHGRFSEAATHYRRAIEIDPSMPGPYQGLGFLMAYAMNRFADAVPLVQKAVELDPGNWMWSMGPLGLPVLYLDLDDESKLFATMEPAETRFPDDTNIQNLLAYIDLIQRDNAGAVRHAERSLALYPRNDSALSILGDADLRGGRYADALARYQKAFPEFFLPDTPLLDEFNYGIAIDLAQVLQKRGDAPRANVLLDRATIVFDKLPRLGVNGYGITDARIHALRGDKAKALAALREAEQAGWRGPLWRYYRDLDPKLASIRNDPEFKAVFADIERDMARQRAELAKRPKDAPLDLGASVK